MTAPLHFPDAPLSPAMTELLQHAGFTRSRTIAGRRRRTVAALIRRGLAVRHARWHRAELTDAGWQKAQQLALGTCEVK